MESQSRTGDLTLPLMLTRARGEVFDLTSNKINLQSLTQDSNFLSYFSNRCRKFYSLNRCMRCRKCKERFKYECCTQESRDADQCLRNQVPDQNYHFLCLKLIRGMCPSPSNCSSFPRSSSFTTHY